MRSSSLLDGVDRFLSIQIVRDLTGKSRSTLWRWSKAGRFPNPIRIGPNSVAWRESEVMRWMEAPARWCAPGDD
jgi:prophage regulatory protein